MGEAFIVKPRSVWLEQARKALGAMEKCGAKDLNEFHDKDHQNFCLMIEALHALGAPVADDMIEKAHLRPVKELLGLP